VRSHSPCDRAEVGWGREKGGSQLDGCNGGFDRVFGLGEMRAMYG
jgi:hypothetical protein